MEGESVAVIDIESSSKMEHNSTSERGGASTGIIFTGVRSGVISAGVIPVHHIRVGDGDGTDSGKANNSYDSIVLSSSFHIGGGLLTKLRRISSNDVWCVSKTSVAPKVQGSATFTMSEQRRRYRRPLEMQSTLSQRTWRGGSESTKYTNI